MIGQVLEFVRKHAHNHLLAMSDGVLEAPGEDLVQFPVLDQTDISFKTGTISLVLVNVEEERVMRGPDLYARTNESGARQAVSPDLRLVLYMLFVARFTNYDQTWDWLSKLITHFQKHRVIDAQSAPDLPAGVERLVMELVTLSQTEQTEVWSGLRATHRPSLLYRVKLAAFHSHATGLTSELGQTDIVVGSKS